MSKEKVLIKTYGCQMNDRDSEAVEMDLLKSGYEITTEEKDADVIILNTCSVRDQAERKALGKVGSLIKLRRKNPKLQVGVIGCMAQSRADDIVEKMAKYQGLFQRFTLGKPKAQMYILQSIEKLIELDPSKLNKVPHYLKQLYDLDLVDEDIFIEWGLNPGKNISNELSSNIQRVSIGFLHWLKN